MSICLQRREFIAALGGAAAWPLAARAQQPALPVFRWSSALQPTTFRSVAVFRKGLSKTGYARART